MSADADLYRAAVRVVRAKELYEATPDDADEKAERLADLKSATVAHERAAIQFALAYDWIEARKQPAKKPAPKEG